MPCVPRLGESARKAKVALSKHRSHVNSVVFLCVAKCEVKGLALLNGTAINFVEIETELFHILYISLLFLLQCSLIVKMIACSLRCASLVDHCSQMNTTDLLHCSVTFIVYNQNN